MNINKSSGTLSLVSVISEANNWTYTAGIINPGTSKVAFIGTLTITGSHTLYDIQFSPSPGTYVYTIAAGTTLTSNGTLTLSGSNADLIINTGTIEAKGDVNVTNSGAFGGGTGTLLINGTGTQTMTGPGVTGQGKLPLVNINKSSGTLNLASVISVAGSWTYVEGTVSSGTSTVCFFTTGNVDAQGMSSTMTFYNVTLADANTRTLLGNINISNVLSLGSGKINLNSNICTITLNSSGAITRSSGYMISESTNNSGKISWNIASTAGSYVYPFATATGTYIPLTFQITAGDVGDVAVSTYPTASNNTPYPTTPDNVTNLNTIGGSDNSTNTIDRFWQIDKTGISGTATVTYTYNQAEVSGGVSGNEALLQAHRYDATKNTWDDALSGQTANGTSNMVVEPGITQFSPRTLALSLSPLPVTLLKFDAKLNGDNVDLVWSTASELNNEYFTIERSKDAANFEFVSKIQGAGNSLSTLIYTVVDDNPYPEISYYRLKQTDYDGKFTYSEIKIIKRLKENDSCDLNCFLSFDNFLTCKYFGKLGLVGLYNEKGQLIYKNEIGENKNDLKINMNEYDNGVYIIRFIDKECNTIKKTINIKH